MGHGGVIRAIAVSSKLAELLEGMISRRLGTPQPLEMVKDRDSEPVRSAFHPSIFENHGGGLFRNHDYRRVDIAGWDRGHYRGIDDA